MRHKQRLKRLYLNARGMGLGRFSSLAASRRRPVSLTKIRRILFIRNDRVGDLVLSLPALEAFRNRFPRARITVLASRSNYTLFNGPTPADDCIVLDGRAAPREQMEMFRRLRREHFDLAVDPFTGPDLRSAVTAFFSRSRIRLGYPGFGREICFNYPAPPMAVGRHFVDANLDLLKPLGAFPASREPRLTVTAGEIELGRRLMEESGWRGQPVVGIHPGGHYWTQRWPEAYFSALIERLQSEENPWIVLFGARGDRAAIESILRGVRKKPMVCMTNDLRRFAAMASVCKVFVCNNSGPLHLVAAMGIQTISTMGPTVKHRWWPLGRGHVVLRKDALSCIGCNSGYCLIRTHECMRGIAPETMHQAVIAKVREIRSESGRKCIAG